MKRLHKLGLALAAGLIGIFCCWGYRLKSEIDKIREKELPQTKQRLELKLSETNQRLDQFKKAFYGQLALISILGEYDANGNEVIDEEEYDQYLKDVLQVERILKQYDTDSSDFLNREELYRLLRVYMNKQGMSQRQSIERMVKHVIKRYDRGRKDGLLNRLELRKLINDYERAWSDRF